MAIDPEKHPLPIRLFAVQADYVITQSLTARIERLELLLKQKLAKSDSDFCMAALNECCGLKMLIEGEISADDYLVARAYWPKVVK